MPPVNTAIIGFGLSGRVFHAPFLDVNKGFMLHTIVTSGEIARKTYPGVRICRDFNEAVLDDEIELIVISTPNEFHYSQIKSVLDAGKHVIAEKPLTMTSQETVELFEIAAKNKCKLFPFHNRRWDGDFLTLRKILGDALLGDILDFEIHFDRYSPHINDDSWRYTKKYAGGTLYDLGIHMIDQIQLLFGLPEAVFCQLFYQRKNSVVDDSFELKMIYPDKNVTVKSSVFVREQSHRMTIHGEKGSFLKYGLDPQEDDLKQGMKPQGKNWGKEDKEQWGLIHSDIDGEIVRRLYETIPGNYMAFFDNVYNVLKDKSVAEVTKNQVINNLRLIEKAIESHRNKNVIPL